QALPRHEGHQGHKGENVQEFSLCPLCPLCPLCRRDHVVCLHRSNATAPTMMVPVTICCTQFGNPCCEQPIWITAMIAAPASVPTTLPLPPRRLPPPMITAAMTSSSRPTATVGSPTDSLENSITPASPARAAPIVYTSNLRWLIRTPH